jgi:hypothetical protein
VPAFLSPIVLAPFIAKPGKKLTAEEIASNRRRLLLLSGERKVVTMMTPADFQKQSKATWHTVRN